MVKVIIRDVNGTRQATGRDGPVSEAARAVGLGKWTASSGDCQLFDAASQKNRFGNIPRINRTR